VFTDDDCLPDRGWIAAFAAAADAPSQAMVLEGRTVAGRPFSGPFETAPVNETGGCLWSCNFAIRAGVFWRHGGFDEAFRHAHLEDVDLRARLGKSGIRPVFTAAATVVHPPRPVGSLARQVRGYESYFYYARKHGVTLTAAGLGWRAFVRWRWSALRSSRSAGEALRYCGRCAAEAAMLGPLCLRWMIRGVGGPHEP
jgi:GT2 family glycosyltransferase